MNCTSFLSGVILEQIHQSASSTLQRLIALSQMEMQAYTQNNAFYTTSQGEIFQEFESLYEQSVAEHDVDAFVCLLATNAIGLLTASYPARLEAIQSALVAAGLSKWDPQKLKAFLPGPTEKNDHALTPALRIMANVCAYFRGK